MIETCDDAVLMGFEFSIGMHARVYVCVDVREYVWMNSIHIKCFLGVKSHGNGQGDAATPFNGGMRWYLGSNSVQFLELDNNLRRVYNNIFIHIYTSTSSSSSSN